MSSASRWRAVAALVAVGGAAAITFTQPIRLGLDLEVGTQITLEARDTPRVVVDDDVGSRTLEVLRRRVDALGDGDRRKEPALAPSGPARPIAHDRTRTDVEEDASDEHLRAPPATVPR